MKEEKLLRAMDGIGDDLIADAMAVPAKKLTRTSWGRWTAVAACLCLLLASPAGAAMQGKMHELIVNAGFTDFFTSERFGMEEFSGEALDAAALQEKGTGFYPVESLTEAEEFLGVELPDNAVLANAKEMTLFIESADGERFETPCMVHLFQSETYGMLCADTEISRRIGDCYINVYYRMATEQMPYENGGGVALNTEDMHRTDYVTPGGLECVLFDRYTGDAFWGYDCAGIAVVDRCLVYVRLHHESRNTALDTMKQIMDAYG